MAKMSASCGRVMWVVVLCAMLLLFATVTQAIRPLQSESRSVDMSLESVGKPEGINHALVIPEETEEIEMDCANLDEEECSMRRTLAAAHTDYIYTQ